MRRSNRKWPVVANGRVYNSNNAVFLPRSVCNFKIQPPRFFKEMSAPAFAEFRNYRGNFSAISMDGTCSIFLDFWKFAQKCCWKQSGVTVVRGLSYARPEVSQRWVCEWFCKNPGLEECWWTQFCETSGLMELWGLRSHNTGGCRRPVTPGGVLITDQALCAPFSCHQSLFCEPVTVDMKNRSF